MRVPAWLGSVDSVVLSVRRTGASLNDSSPPVERCAAVGVIEPRRVVVHC